MRAEASAVFVPNYKVTAFSNREQLFDYVESPDYMLTDEKKGVCFGFEVIENAPNDYTMNLYYND